MSLVNLLQVRDQAVAQLKAVYASRKDILVDSLPGPLDETGIKHLAARVPCVMTSLVRLRTDQAAGSQNLDFVTWVLGRATAKDPGFGDTLLVLSVLEPALRGLNADWSTGGASEVDAKNLYTGSLNQLNLTLWAVSWTWPVRGAVVELPGDGTGVPGEVTDILTGGIPMPDGLADFEGYDATTKVGTQVEGDSTTL